MTNGQILKQAHREPEIFEVKDDIKRWLQTMRTLQKKGYDYRKRDIIRLEELNKYPTGDTILWDDVKRRFVVGRKARDIYFPTPPPPPPPPPPAQYGCRAYLNHRQVIPGERQRTKIELDMCSYGDEMFDKDDHSIIIPESAPRYLVIGEVWYDFGAVDKGVYSVVVAKNGKPLSKDALIERDDMCPSSGGKDIQPHGVDVWPLEKGDRISLWTVFYTGGPCELKAARTQNYLTVVKLA